MHRTRSASDLNGDSKDVLFDIDAIRAELASEQIHVREIESTLPPMKLNLDAAKSGNERPSNESLPNLRPTRSLDTHTTRTMQDTASLSSPSLAYTGPASPAYLRRGEVAPAEPVDSPRLETIKADRSFEASRNSPNGLGLGIRPELKSSYTMPADIGSLERNAWVDDDPSLVNEPEITMTFE